MSNKYFEKNIFTPRERVRKAFRREDIDRLPAGEICIDDAVIARYLQCPDVGFEERLEFVKALDYDIYSFSPEVAGDSSSLQSVQDFDYSGLKKWVLNTDIFTFALLDGVFDWGIKLFGFKDFMLLPIMSPQECREKQGVFPGDKFRPV